VDSMGVVMGWKWGGCTQFLTRTLLLLMWSIGFIGDLCVAVTVSQPAASSSNFPAASFIFGDSLVDAGNNNYIGSLARANYGANGIDFPGGKPTGRFCNGRTVADIVGKPLLQCTLLS
jgi:hypothetical protein